MDEWCEDGYLWMKNMMDENIGWMIMFVGWELDGWRRSNGWTLNITLKFNNFCNTYPFRVYFMFMESPWNILNEYAWSSQS